MPRKTKLDFYFANHGSATLLTPLSKSAKAWIDENIMGDNSENVQTFGNAIVIEPRYAGPILQGIQDDGLTVGV